MNSRGVTWKSVVLTFVVATVFYLIAYSWLSKRQTGKGPWQVTFNTAPDDAPQIMVNQPSIGITNVIVRFGGEHLNPTNRTGSVSFAKPRQRTPFGRVAYDDLMFQPGIVVIAVLFSAGVGVAFGYFPARRAARLDPIEALRHE